MFKPLKIFLWPWLAVLIANQVLFFNSCIKIYCIKAALPHTFLISLFLVYIFLKEGKREKVLPIKNQNGENVFSFISKEMSDLSDLLEKENETLDKWNEEHETRDHNKNQR